MHGVLGKITRRSRDQEEAQILKADIFSARSATTLLFLRSRFPLPNLPTNILHPSPRPLTRMSNPSPDLNAAQRPPTRFEPAENIQQGNLRLLASGQYSDLTLKCGTSTFRVHRSIICPQSDFFAGCVDSGMKLRLSPPLPSYSSQQIT